MEAVTVPGSEESEGMEGCNQTVGDAVVQKLPEGGGVVGEAQVADEDEP